MEGENKWIVGSFNRLGYMDLLFPSHHEPNLKDIYVDRGRHGSIDVDFDMGCSTSRKKKIMHEISRWRKNVSGSEMPG